MAPQPARAPRSCGWAPPFALGCVLTWALLSLAPSSGPALPATHQQLRAVERAAVAESADSRVAAVAAAAPGGTVDRPVSSAPAAPPASASTRAAVSAAASAAASASTSAAASSDGVPSPAAAGPPSNTPTTTPSGTFSNLGSATHTQTTETEAQMRARMAAEYARAHGGSAGPAHLARMTPAERALHDRLESPLAQPHCSATWAERVRAYGRFHNESVSRLLAGESLPGTRIVVFQCREAADGSTEHTPDCGGFADRLAGMSHVFLLALMGGGGAASTPAATAAPAAAPQPPWLFFADWRGQPDVFGSPFFEYAWRAPLGGARPQKTHNFLSCPYQSDYDDCPLGLADPAATFPLGAVHFIAINKGGLRWARPERVAALLQPAEWGLDKWTQGGCVYRALLRPTPAVLARLAPMALQLLSPLYTVVGVHKRTGDKQMHGVETAVAFAPTDRYWQCAMRKENELRNYTRGEQPARYFLVTDSAAYKRDALAHFGADKLFVTDVEPIHVAQMQLMWDGILHRDRAPPSAAERLARAFIDWWLLSLCPIIVAPGFSGFSRTAFAMSMARVAYLMENFEGQYMTGCREVDAIPQWRMVALGAGF